jgi:signal transduction histidine kinase
MFNEETKEFVEELLRFFSLASKIPIAIYGPDNNGEMIEHVRSEREFFPEHCREVWALSNGKGEDRCVADMCARSKKAIESGLEITLCHAGLTNVTELIRIDGEKKGVIQYGAFRFKEENSEDKQLRLTKHREAVKVSEVSEEQATKISALLMSAPEISRERLERLKNQLTPILSNLIAKYIKQNSDDKQSLENAYHDIQIRMQGALAEIEVLQMETATSEDAKQRFAKAIAAIDSASTTLHSLTQGQYLPDYYDFHQFEIKNFILRSIEKSKAQADYRGIEIRDDLQPINFNYKLQASEEHLQLAFDNLLQNAVKYSYRTSQHSRHRFVSVKGKPVDSGYHVTIENYGVGIASDERDKIFETGYRGRMTQKEHRTGSGRGLALTKKIIEQHHGRIEVQSVPMGEEVIDGTIPYRTRFIVWLPAKQPGKGDSYDNAK